MGEATAKELSKRGWQVAVMFSKNTAEADRVAGDINGMALQGDVAQDADCRRVAKAVLEKWGRIDALVNRPARRSSWRTAISRAFRRRHPGIFRVNFVGPFQ